jgi:hypothetical protein
MKTISLKLPTRLHVKLVRAAQARKQSTSTLVRTALEQALNGENDVHTGTLLDAFKPWIGCVDGPGDLSTNPRYLEDFGK